MSTGSACTLPCAAVQRIARRWRERGAPGAAAAFNRAFSERAADGQALGLMLHHAVMNQDEFSLLMQWSAG